MKFKLFSFFVLISGLSAEAKLYEITENGADVKIPTKIWDEFGKVEGRDSITLSPIKVRLVEKTPGVLEEPEIEIKLPRGGGHVDLSRFVKGNQGTFRVFFELEEMTDEDKLRAFYISHARKRRVDSEIWGAGCHKYMDIKNFILHEGKKKGIEVNTTRNRHDSLLGGTFFFSSGHQVTQVTFTDSQQPQLFCQSAEDN